MRRRHPGGKHGSAWSEATGLISHKALEVARLHLLESGHRVDYREVSAETLAEERPAPLDIVTCMELLEHVPDPGRTIKARATLVKPGGHVFFDGKSQPEVIPVRHYRRRVRVAHASQRYARLHPIICPSELTAGSAPPDSTCASLRPTFNPLTLHRLVHRLFGIRTRRAPCRIEASPVPFSGTGLDPAP